MSSAEGASEEMALESWSMKQLLVGCGSSREKRVWTGGPRTPFDDGLVTLDNRTDAGADVVHDLEVLPYPFADNEFDEIHAYDVLEHTGAQGDHRFFFAQWTEFYRILKIGGHFLGIVPAGDSPWLWGDPSHKRVINQCSLTFLSQAEYTKQVGKSAMSDYRQMWSGNFETINTAQTDDAFIFVMQKVGLP